MENKRILFLGASVYFLDAAKYVKSKGMYLVAVDIKELPQAVVKAIADESYHISTTDLDTLYELCVKCKINGIYAGASEVNIPIAMELCKRLNLPYYANKRQWEMCTNKAIFKQKCVENGIKVSKEYEFSKRGKNGYVKYPVVTKPVDNNGSTGISICQNLQELEKGYKKGMDNSKIGHVLIEEYIPSDSVIIQYTIQDGNIKYSGMSDKKSKKLNEDGAPVMAIQYFPSIYEEQYLSKVNKKAIRMLKEADMQYGAVWIESFYYKNEFIFNEIGYRYGGSLTYFPVEFFYNLNQMNILIHHAVTGKGLYQDFNEKKVRADQKKYAILPIHIKPCVIKAVSGIDELENIPGFYRFVQSHSIGETIPDSGTTLQVFGYVHVIGDSIDSMIKTMQEVKDRIHVIDETGKNKIFTIWEL